MVRPDRSSDESIDPQYMKPIQDLKPPQTLCGINMFLKLVRFYDFKNDFSKKAAPLKELSRSDEPLEWTKEHLKAFEDLIKGLTNKPTVKIPNLNDTFIVQCDASGKGVGAVLCQKTLDVVQPVIFAARPLDDIEINNNSPLEKECIAIMFALWKFYDFIEHKKFILQIDPEGLVHTIQDDSKLKILKYGEVICNYKKGLTFTVEKNRSQKVAADFLSRLHQFK